MQRSTVRNLGASALVTTMSTVAGAASAADLTVTFSPAVAPAAVPLSPEMMLVVGLVMAIGAVVIMRKRGMGNGLAFGLAATIGLTALGTANYARAAEDFTLTGPSPQAFTLQDNGGQTTITNSTGSDVTIDAVTVDPPFVILGGNCVGEIVLAGDSCEVFVAQPV